VTREKPTPLSLCPPQITHALFWYWNRAAAVRSRQLAKYILNGFIYLQNVIR
jgi:hypothetical protein